jgi:hypothetical protein
MPPEDIAVIEAQLDPSARLLFVYFRGLIEEQKAQLFEREAAHLAQLAARDELLKTLTEQLVIANEQIADLKRRLFGPCSERFPTVAEELRREVQPDELTVDGEPMPTDPTRLQHERDRKARRKSEPKRQRKRSLRKGLPLVVEQRTVASTSSELRLPLASSTAVYMALGYTPK